MQQPRTDLLKFRFGRNPFFHDTLTTCGGHASAFFFFSWVGGNQCGKGACCKKVAQAAVWVVKVHEMLKAMKADMSPALCEAL